MAYSFLLTLMSLLRDQGCHTFHLQIHPSFTHDKPLLQEILYEVCCYCDKYECEV